MQAISTFAIIVSLKSAMILMFTTNTGIKLDLLVMRNFIKIECNQTPTNTNKIRFTVRNLIVNKIC